MTNNWYVITGGPCSGKSTTIHILAERGFSTTQEVAREYYESQMKLGFTNEELRSDPQKLQDGIAKSIVQLEQNIDPHETIFLDRGIPDNIGYFEYYNLTPPKFITDAYNACRYKKVFYLERLAVQVDAVRVESEEQIQLLADLALKYYNQKNADIVRVPVMDKNSRVDFILKHLE